MVAHHADIVPVGTGVLAGRRETWETNWYTFFTRTA